MRVQEYLPRFITAIAWAHLCPVCILLPCYPRPPEAGKWKDSILGVRIQRHVSPLRSSFARPKRLMLFLHSGMDGESFAAHMSRHAPVPIPYTTAGTAIALVLGARYFWMFFSSFLQSRWTWGILSMIAILTFTAGHMFVKIRKMPYTVNGRNGPQWIASGYQNQYGMETQVVALLC
jgi:hypothetical protein